MYSPPFHRRILPWIFAAVFLAAAPVVVFYTAGYRWNPKKDKVERNGTMILNSRPADAIILLNGSVTDETTPATLQNIPPGRVQIRFEKEGYHPWEKQLEVLPQFVTFANNVWLWKKSQPRSLQVSGTTQLEASPNERLLASLVTSSGASDLVIWSPGGTDRSTYRLNRTITGHALLSWSEDSRAVFIEERFATGTSAWLVDVRSARGPIALPEGTYRWNGSRLEGMADGSLLEIRADDETLSRRPLPPGALDQHAGFILRHATGTDNLVLFKENRPNRGLILPAGNWRFHSQSHGRTILRDGSSWLSLDPDESDPHIVRAWGDAVRPFEERRRTNFLLVHGGEVWSWDPTKEPELLLRESASVAEASWHSTTDNVILASNGAVSILNLDPRDGRLRTTLANFEEVYDVALIKKNLYISARQDGKSDVWELEIE